MEGRPVLSHHSIGVSAVACIAGRHALLAPNACSVDSGVLAKAHALLTTVPRLPDATQMRSEKFKDGVSTRHEVKCHTPLVVPPLELAWTG